MLETKEIQTIISEAALAAKYKVTCVSEAYGSTLVEVHNQGTLNFRLHAFAPDFESTLNIRLGNLEKDPSIKMKAKFSKKVTKTLGKMYQYMGARTQQGGVELLDKMVAKADKDKAYADAFLSVLKNKEGASVELRELANSFGAYYVGVKHQNKVDAIDSAVNMLHDKTRNKENDDLSM